MSTDKLSRRKQQNRAILQERARQLRTGQMQGIVPDTSTLREVLVFTLPGSNDRYGVAGQQVASTTSLAQVGLTPVPCTPQWVAGVVQVYGRITTVIDLARFAGLSSGSATAPFTEPDLPNDLHTDDFPTLVILQHEDRTLALLTGRVLGVQALTGRGAPAPDTWPQVLAGLLSSVHRVGEHQLAVLDGPRLVDHPGLQVNQQVAGGRTHDSDVVIETPSPTNQEG